MSQEKKKAVKKAGKTSFNTIVRGERDGTQLCQNQRQEGF